MDLTVDLDEGRDAAAASVRALLRAVDGCDEYDLLGASRCHGWSRLDVVVHVIGGWHEMLGGLVSVVDAEPTVDAASYWPAFAAEYGGDVVPTLMTQRRRTAAYARPSAAIAQLHDVAAAVLRGVERVGDGRHLWQGHVFTAGDHLAVWAVEDVVHHLDLLTDEPAPSGALGIARRTIEALAGERLPGAWSDMDAVLVGTGRLPVPADAGALARRLPVLG